MKRDQAARDLYRRLVEAHGAELYRFAYRSCGDPHTAEDLVAETCAEAWRSLPGLREPDRGRAWLFRILRRRCGAWYRERSAVAGRTQPLEEIDEPVAPGPDPLESLAMRESLQHALDRIEPRYKEPLLMTCVEGLSCREVADALELPLGTVLSRIHRAREMLRRLLAAEERRAGNVRPPAGWRRIEGSR